MSKDAYYFSHDSNAKDDPKCMLLIDQLGLEGYGIYWVLIEVLRDQPDYAYPLKLVPILARRYNTTAEKMMTVIQKYGLFEFNEDENFFSLSLNKRMERIEGIREQKRLAGIASAEKRKLLSEGQNEQNSTDVQQMFNICSTMKRKEKKVNEIKLKEIEVEFDRFWNLYDKKVGSKQKLFKKWSNLSQEDKDKIFETLPKYVASSEKQFRKNPETYLNNEAWNDEIIVKQPAPVKFGTPQPETSVNKKWGRE